MKIAIIKICILLACVCLSACQSTASKKTCGCDDYFDTQPKPDWVGHDKVTDAVYQTQGISYCTGLKTVDIDRTDKSAKANLVRMIQSEIKSTQNIKQGTYIGGTTVSHFTEKTTINSDLIVEGAYIQSRWLDRDNCTLYSSVRIDRTAIENALKNKDKVNQSKLTNQLFSLDNIKENAVKSKIKAILSELKIATSNENHSLQINTRIMNINHVSDQLLRLELAVEIYDPIYKRAIWAKHFFGKGVSFESKTATFLKNKAIKNASKKMEAELKHFLKTSSRQTSGSTKL